MVSDPMTSAAASSLMGISYTSRVGRSRDWPHQGRVWRVVVVVVDELTGCCDVLTVVCSVVVVLVTWSELLQPDTNPVPTSSAATSRGRRQGIVLVMTGLRCRRSLGQD